MADHLRCIDEAKFPNSARGELGLRPQHLCLIPEISGQNIPSNGLLEQWLSKHSCRFKKILRME